MTDLASPVVSRNAPDGPYESEPTGRPTFVAPDLRARTGRLIGAYVAVSAVLTALYYVFPGHHLPFWTPVGVLAVVAMVVGIRLHRPSKPLGWYLLAAAVLLFIAGDTTYNVLTEVMDRENPYPSAADALYLCNFPLFAIGLLLLIRSRGVRDRGGVLDAAIMTTGLGLLSWVYLVVPALQEQGGTTVSRLVSVAYPVGDMLLLGMLARLLTSGALRIRSVQLLVLGAVGVLASDVIYGSAQLTEAFSMGGAADLGWIVFYVAWGAAALSPSMHRVTENAHGMSSEVQSGRILLLGALGLIAPAVLLSDAITNGGKNAISVGVFSGVLYVLVVIRFATIVTVHRQSLARERVLRVAGESLVAAQTTDEISAAALAGVATLTDHLSDVAVALQLIGTDGVQRVARSGRPPAVCGPDLLASGDTAASGLSLDGFLSTSPLRYDHAIRGMLTVRTTTRISSEVHGALTTLAAQVALALESDRLAANLRRRQNEAHFAGLIQNASDVIVVIRPDGELTYGVSSLQRALDLAEAPSETQLLDLLHPDDATVAVKQLQDLASGVADDQPPVDWRILHADGKYRSFEVVSKNMLDDVAVAGVVLTMRDVSLRRELETQLTYQAFHDGLTGLPNRALFQDRARHALTRLDRTPQLLAMVMLDLDNFKDINDSHGHGIGDDVLRAVSRRITLAMRPGDTAARLGGDEFAVLLENVPNVADAEAVAARVLESFLAPFVIDEEVLFVHASAGLVLAGTADSDVDLTELLLRADLALYAAKERGKGHYRRYDPSLRDSMVDRLTRRADLKLAVDNDEFFLQYQPIVQIDTGEVVSAEALVRWMHPRLGLISPDDFISLAEETGLIVPLGRWVLNNACAQARIWNEASAGGVRMCVNVSARQLQEPTFVDDVKEAILQHRITPGLLVLELTETVLFHDVPEITQRLAALKQLGVKIAIDDFGTGYSSLGYLQQFAIDVLKVDKSFIDGLGKGSTDAGALAHAMVSLAHLLRLEVVAEGIERTEQRDELWSIGCGLGQGFFYSRPLDAERLTALLDGSAHLGGPSMAAVHGAMAQLRTHPAPLAPDSEA